MRRAVSWRAAVHSTAAFATGFEVLCGHQTGDGFVVISAKWFCVPSVWSPRGLLHWDRDRSRRHRPGTRNDPSDPFAASRTAIEPASSIGVQIAKNENPHFSWRPKSAPEYKGTEESMHGGKCCELSGDGDAGKQEYVLYRSAFFLGIF